MSAGVDVCTGVGGRGNGGSLNIMIGRDLVLVSDGSLVK